MKPFLLASGICAALLCILPSGAQAPPAHPKTSTAKPSAGSHSPTAAARPSLLNPASLTAKAPAEFKVAFTTSAGDFIVQVHRDWAPIGADRFYNLVRRG